MKRYIFDHENFIFFISNYSELIKRTPICIHGQIQFQILDIIF